DGLVLPPRSQREPDGLRAREVMDRRRHCAGSGDIQQRAEVLADDVFGTVVEQAFKRGVAEGDALFRIDGDDGDWTYRGQSPQELKTRGLERTGHAVRHRAPGTTQTYACPTVRSGEVLYTRSEPRGMKDVCNTEELLGASTATR